MKGTADGPKPPAARIASLDALRGVALCGILLINIIPMGGPIAMDRPMAPPAAADADWQLWILSQLFVTGTMRGLFSLLFGAGLLIFIGEDRDGDRSALYMRRLAALLLFGIIDSTLLLWPGDILVTYAVAGLFVMIFHSLRPAWLLVLAAIILAAASGWAAIEARSVTPAETIYTPAMLAREGAARLGGYAEAFRYLSFVSLSWTFDIVSLRWVADTGALMMIGMALYRTGLLAKDADPRTLAAFAVVGYAIGLLLRLAHLIVILENGGAPTFASGLIDQPGRVAMTLGHVGLFQLFWRSRAMPQAKRLLGLMGRMALTLYLGQSVAAATLFSGFGFGLWNQLTWAGLWLAASGILVGEAIFALLWLQAFRYGPVEWLWRYLTYGSRPAMH